MKDIFISYRRKDAETVAYLLYKDLTKDGYSVFFDHKTLGGGDFRSAIDANVRNAKDIIIILSESSFDEKINSVDDVYRNEIEFALQYGKRIIGIILEDFPGFPENLPDSISAIRNMNCLKLYIGYYEAMYNRLVSGSFLSMPSNNMQEILPSEEAIKSTIPRELQNLSKLTDSQRFQYMQMLLHIMDSFNNSQICMRFYRYIDLYDRNKGIAEIPAYDGVIPTDLVTYLSFFETLYILVGSGTLDISVIDFTYRFRFFAGCNIPIMQESELLPLGYQYPNIMSLYNMWSEYIVEKYDHTVKCDSISEEIPLYEYDLHKRYAAYCFANKPGRAIKVRFLNRHLIWMNLTMKTIESDQIDICMNFQERVLKQIEGNDEKNIFEPLTKEEMQQALCRNECIGLYDGPELVAQMNLLLKPNRNENIALDLADTSVYENAAVLDYVLVSEQTRGYAIQKTLLFVAECIAKNYRKSGICAVTSPFNTFSIKNFISQGYHIVDTKPKYKSTRHYLWKSLADNNIQMSSLAQK